MPGKYHKLMLKTNVDAKKMLPLQAGDVPATYADVSGLIEEFGYIPNTSHTEGIAQFVNWYNEFYEI